MGKLFIVDQAECICKYGTAPAKLKVSSHGLMFINANKKIATSMDLENCFYPPAFATCKYSSPSRPCKVMVTKWSNLYEKLRVAGNAYPLMPDSKATCAVAGKECIEIAKEGQIEILGKSQTKNTTEHQADLDPMGDPMALGDEQKIIVIANII